MLMSNIGTPSKNHIHFITYYFGDYYLVSRRGRA